MDALREDLCRALPLAQDELTLRPCQRQDLDRLASWPPYPWPYQAFDFRFRAYTPEQRDAHFAKRVTSSDRIALACDLESRPTAGYVALVRIDWIDRTAGNMTLRVHLSHCGHGIGTRTLQLVCGWWFDHRLRVLRLDVAASNRRAIRCYQKAGFVRDGEFWREALDLTGADLCGAKYDFLRARVRFTGNTPEIRFYWMIREP